MLVLTRMKGESLVIDGCVKVKVLEVDVPRKRISLTMRLDAQPTRSGGPRENRYEALGRGAKVFERDIPRLDGEFQRVQCHTRITIGNGDKFFHDLG